MALAKTTQDHEEIRQWAEARGGKPAVVAATESKDQTGIIRLMFPNAPNHNDDALEEIAWDEWFEKFDESGLQLTYQEKTADGQKSDFNKLTYPDPESAEGKALLKRTAAKKGAKSSAKKSAGTKSAGTKAVGKKSAGKKAEGAAPAKKSAGKTAAKKSVAKKVAAKKTAAKKSSGKKTSGKSASKKTSPATPARNYPKPESGGSGQVF